MHYVVRLNPDLDTLSPTYLSAGGYSREPRMAQRYQSRDTARQAGLSALAALRFETRRGYTMEILED